MMEQPAGREELLCSTEVDEETSLFHKKRSRRVSFADTTSVHVFDRDDDLETQPDSRPNEESDEASGWESSAARDKKIEDDHASTEADDGGFKHIVLEMESPGTANDSVTSNDEHQYFGPVSTNFIRSRALLESPAADDITLDSTAFSMQFGKLLQSGEISKTSSGFCFTSDCDTTPTEHSEFTSSGNKMVLTEDKRLHTSSNKNSLKFKLGSASNEMSIVTDESQKYDYAKLSPRSDGLLSQYYKYFPTSSGSSTPGKLSKVNSPVRDLVDPSTVESFGLGDGSDIVSESHVYGGRLYSFGHKAPIQPTPEKKSVLTMETFLDIPLHSSRAPERNNFACHMETSEQVVQMSQLGSSPGRAISVPKQQDSCSTIQKHSFSPKKSFVVVSSRSAKHHEIGQNVLDGHKLDESEDFPVCMGGAATLPNEKHSSISTPKLQEAGMVSARSSPGSISVQERQASEILQHIVTPRKQVENVINNRRLDEPQNSFLRSKREGTNLFSISEKYSPNSIPRVSQGNESPLLWMTSILCSKKRLLLNETFSPLCNIEISTPFSVKAGRKHQDFIGLTSSADRKVFTPYAVVDASQGDHESNQLTPAFSLSGAHHHIQVLNAESNRDSIIKQVKPLNTKTEVNTFNVELGDKNNQDGPVSNCAEFGKYMKPSCLNSILEDALASPVSAPPKKTGDEHQFSQLGNSLSDAASSLSNTFKPLRDAFLSSLSRMRYKDLCQLEDMLEELRKVIKYRRLSAKVQAQKTKSQLENMKLQRILEARLLGLELPHERLKFHIMQMKRDILQKNIQQLELGVEECHKLKLMKLEPVATSETQAPTISSFDNTAKMALQRVEMLRQEFQSLDQKVKKLVESLHRSCKLKGSLDPDEALSLVKDYVRKKSCCTSVTTDLQRWKLDDVEVNHDKRTMFLKYGGFLNQRFAVDCDGLLPSVQSLYSFNESFVDKMFPSINACVAFRFVFSSDSVQTFRGVMSIQQEAQAVSHLLGNLLDVLQEVQLAKLQSPCLVLASFDSPSAGELELRISLIGCNMECRTILVFDATDLKRAVYPSESIPSQLLIQTAEQPASESRSSAQILDAIQNLKFGSLRIIRICQAVSQLLHNQVADPLDRMS